MPNITPECIPPKHMEKAEEIRAYLVSVRGGAYFLSGADGLLLVQWLDQGHPVPAILCAIDRVAARRRAKRTRARMSLGACKGELRKVLGGKDRRRSPKTHKGGYSGWLGRLCAMEIPEGIRGARLRMVDRLAALEGTECREEAARKGATACREFHQEVWEASMEEHESLQQQAEAELESMASLLPPSRWREAVEEIMRDKLRSRYPLVSAQAVWEALNQGEER